MARRSHPRFQMVEMVVEGRGNPPMDMLRYDQCAPASGADAALLERNIGHELRRVRLRRYYPVGGAHEPEFGRWESFGWRVVELDGAQVKESDLAARFRKKG